jgi:hypothetical protein
LRTADGRTPGLATSAWRNEKMLWTIFANVVILWLLGLVTSHVFGGFIHILLVLAIVAVLIRIIQGRSLL